MPFAEAFKIRDNVGIRAVFYLLYRQWIGGIQKVQPSKRKILRLFYEQTAIDYEIIVFLNKTGIFVDNMRQE